MWREPAGAITRFTVKRHLVTFFFLVLAIVCYSIGAAGPGTFLLLLGMLAEVTFWFRIAGTGKKTPKN